MKNLKNLILMPLMVLVVLFGSGSVWGQQTLFWRSGTTRANWFDSENPWFRSCDSYNVQRPDDNQCNTYNTTFGRTFVNIDNNSQTTMSVNGQYFDIKSLTFKSGASTGRTFNAVSNGGISVDAGIGNEDANTNTHTFNVPIALAGSCTFNSNNATYSFTSNFFLNNFTATFQGNNSVSGVISQSGGTGSVIKSGSGNLTLSNSANTYTGNTTITAGTLTLNPSANATFASPIVLNGGTLATTGITSTRTWTSSSTLGLTANSTIALASTTAHTITFAASNAVSWTATANLVITGWSGTPNGTSNGTTGKIFIGSSSSGLTASQLARIYFSISGSHYTATQLSTGEIVPTANIAMFWGATTTASWTVTSGTRWDLSPTGTTFGTNWSSGRAAVFNVANSAITYPGTSTAVASISANENVTLTAGTTFTTGGIQAPFFVASGKTLDFAAQGISTAAGTGIIKNGPGTFISANGSNYPGGFTLNDGLMVVGGVNAMGNGGTLTINGGTLGTSNNRNITARYGAGGIVIGGNFTIGATGYTANFTFADNVSLGSSTRTITLGAAASHTFSGIISGSAGVGLTLNATAAGTLILGAANTYSGSTTIGSSATLRLGIANAIPVGNPGGGLILNGGSLSTGATTGFSNGTSSTNNMGTLTLQSSSTIALGTGDHSLYFSGASFTAGQILTISGWTGSPGVSGTEGKIFIGNSASLTSAQLQQINFTGTGINNTRVIQLSTGEIVPSGTIYETITSGTWASASTWRSSTNNGSTWTSPASAAPTSSDGVITIKSGHTVTVAASVTADQLVVDAGGQITIDGAAGTRLTIADGAGTDMSVSGYVKVTTSELALSGTGTPTIVFNSGSTYEHNRTFVSYFIPSATWNTGSTCKLTGASSIPSSDIIQTFDTLTVAWTDNTARYFNTNVPTVNGMFKIESGVVGLTNTTGTNSTINVKNFRMTGGGLNLNNNTSNATAGRISASGNVLLEGGTLQFSTGSLGTGWISCQGNLTIQSGLTLSGFVPSTSGFLFNGTGSSTVFINKALTTSAGGLGTRFYTLTTNGPTSVSESYGDNVAQNTINGSTTPPTNYSAWPTSGSLLSNLTINNSAGVTMTTAKTVNGTLTLSNGKLTTNGNALTLSNAVSGASSSNYIVADATGTVTFNGVTTARVLPIGTASSYAPLTVTAGSSTNYTTYVTTASSTSPCAAADGTRIVNLAWGLSGSNTPSQVVFEWPAGSHAASFNAAASCDLGRQNAATCPYTTASIGIPSGSGPYTLTCTSGLGSTNNIYVIGNQNAIVVNNAISTGTISGTPLCAGGSVSVPFTYSPTSSFTSGTAQFTAQLSNSSGSFASPVSIGTATSDASGSQTISATIPSNTSAGSGYRIRVISSSPSVTGTDNGTNISINLPASANAGSAATICSGTAYTLTGASVGGSASTGAWSITGVTGTMTNASSQLSSTSQTASPASVTFTPISGNTGTVTLTLTTDDPAGACASASNTVTLTVTAPATANAGSAATICSGAAYTLTGAAVGGSASTGAWSITGVTGTMTTTSSQLSSTSQSASPASVTFTPSSGNTGTVTLTLTTDDPVGTCTSASNTVTLTVTAPATANAGSATTICSGAAYTLTGASVGGGASTGAWSITGVTGSMTTTSSQLSSTSQTASPATITFTPTSGNTGTVTLTLTTDDPVGTCAAATSTVTLTVTSSVGGTATATSSTVCLNGSTSISLSGHTGSTIQWQRSENAGTSWSNISGATSSSYTTPNLVTSTSYRANVTNGSCSASTSSTASVSIGEANTSVASSATYNGGWSNSQNDNIPGLGAWSLSATGTAGFFTGSSDVDNGGSRSWGMYASGGSNVASAVRTVSMSIGNTLSFSMDNGSIDNGKTIGFALQNASGENLMELLFIGGQSVYQILDNAGTNNTSIGFTSGGLDVTVAYTSDNTYAIYVTGKGGATASYTGRTFSTRSGGQIPAQIRFFNAGAGTNSSYDLFFNSLSISNPVITAHPSNTAQNVCQNGSTTSLSVTASGTSLTYQWYSNTTASNSGGTLIDLATSSSYTPSAATAGTLYYYCVVTNGSCGSATSRVSGAVTVVTSTTSISPSATQNISISTNGTQLTVSTGTATVSSSAWKYSTTSGSGYVAFSPPQTGTTYTPNFATSGTYYVICEVTYSSPCGVVTSNEVQIAVAANSITTGTISGSPFCAGATGISVPFTYSGASSFPSATFKAQLSNSSGSFASPVDLQTVASDNSGSQSISITIPSNTAEGTGYRIRVVSDNPALSGTGNGTNLTVNATSVGGSISGGTTVCTGTNSTNLTLSGNTGSVTKWQSSTSSDFSSAVSDITNSTSSLTATNLTSTTYYRAVVTNGVCSAANSSSATITVTPASVGGTVSGGSAICLGSTSASLSLSGNTGTITKWQSAVSPFSSWSDIASTAGLSSYTSGALSQTTQFRAVVNNGVCPDANSSAASVTVDQSNADAGAYSSSWASSSKDGATGLNSWTLSTTGAAGHFTSNSDIDVNSKSLGMYANSGGEANAIRPFASNLSTGSTLNFSIDNGTVQSTGVVGFSLRNSSSQNLMEFYYTGGASFYTINDFAGASLTSVPYTASGLRISISYTAANTYAMSVTPVAGGSTTYFTGRTFTTTGSSNQVPREIRFFNFNAGSGSAADFYLNSISLNRPSIGTETNFAAQNLCQNATPSTLSVAAYGTGLSYQWYQNTSASTTGATAITNETNSSYTPSTASAGTLYYYCIVSGTCSSVRSNFSGAVTITASPAAPTGSASQTFCSAASPTVASLTATGTSLKWYDASTNGNLLSSSTALVNSTVYYASQTVSGCESPSRLAVTATVNNPSAPTGSASQSFCSATSPTVASLSATGSSIQWYAASTGGTALATNTALVDNTIYYASQTVSSCESTSRLAVTATITSSPSAPTGSASQSFCSSASPTVASLSATGTSIQWYAASSGGSALATNTALVNSTTYHASQTVSGCESASRLSVTVTLNASATYGTVSNFNTNTNLVISQVYGGGGLSSGSATYSRDYVEIFNPTSSSQSLAGWTIQYCSDNGTSWSKTGNLTGSIAAGKYYLVQMNLTGSVGSALPTPDFTVSSSIQMSATAGKVALVSNSTTLSGGCPSSASIIDFVGYGSTADCSEGGTTFSNLSATLAAFRNNNGCTDTGDNGSDFTRATPSARNSSSAANDCSGIVETDCSGDTPSAMSVSGASGSSSFSYQWYSQSGQVSAPTGTSISGWTSLGSTDGANTATYTPTSGISSTTTYACFVTPTGTPSCGTGTWATSCRQVLINSVTGGTVAGSTSVCSGGDPAAFTQSVASTGSGTLSYQWESSASSNFSTTITTIAGATSTTYDVLNGITSTTYYRRKVTSLLNGKSCSAYSNTLTVTVNALPTISGTTSVCVNGTTQLTGSGTAAASNAWVIASNATKASVNGTGLVTGLISGTPSPTVTYTDNNGCTSAASTITVNALPTVSFTTSPAATICSATSATYTTQPGQSNYVWSVPGTLNTDYTIASGGIGTSSNSVTINWLTSGSKTVTVNYNNTNGCSASSAASNTTNVTVSPTTSNAGSAQSICSGNTATLAANTPSVGSGAWTVTSGPSTLSSQFSSLSSPSAVFTPAGGAGSYALTWTTSNGSCTSSSNVTITVNAVPVTTGVSICQGGSGSLEANGFVNSGITFSGTWATTPTAFIPSLSTSAQTSTCGFSSTVIRNYVATQFQVSVSGTYNFEMTSSTAFDGMGYITSGTFSPGSCSSGTWIKGDDDGGAGNEPLITASLTAGTIYTLYSTTYSTTSGTTTYTGSFSWTVTPPSGGEIMLPSDVNWFTAASGGTSIGTGASFNPVGVSNSGLANTNTAGTTTYYAAFSGIPACRAAANFAITAAANAGSLSGTQGICVGGSTTFTSSGDAGGSWSTSNSNVATVNSSTGEISGVAVGTATITYTVTGTSPCSNATATRTVTVNSAFASGQINATGQTICSGGTPSEIGSTTSASGGGGSITYSWRSSADNYTSAIDGATSATYTPPLGLTSTTGYRRYANDGTCNTTPTVSTGTWTVTVNSIPSAPTASAQSFCSASSPTIASLQTTSGTSIKWYDAATDGNLLSSGTALTTGTYYASQTVSSCESSRTSVGVTVSSTPSAPAASAQSLCSGSTVSNLGATGDGIQWYSESSGGTPLASGTALSTGTYHASQTVSTCESSSRTSVAVTINPTGTWIGGSTGEWNVAGNWCGGVPDQNTEVATIPSGVTVTVNTSPTILTYTLASSSIVNLGNNTITIANSGSFTNNGTFNAGSGTVAFAGAGTLDGSAATTFNNLTVSGALTVNTSPTVNGTLTLNNGGSITTNPIIYGASATLVYNQGGSITSGLNEWPTINPPRNVTIQNASNVTLNGARTINGVLTLTSGDLIIGVNNLTLGSAATVSSASAVSHIVATSTGEVRKIYGGNGSFTFPVGDGTYHTPATVNFTSGSSLSGETNDYLGVRLKTSKVTNMNSNNTNFIKRSWFIEPGIGLSGYTYNVNLSYNNNDVQGTESEIRPVKKSLVNSDSVWQYPGNVSFADGMKLSGTTGEIDASSNVLSWSGLTSFSEFGGGGQGGPLPVELLYFSADCKEKRVSLNWSTASEKNSSHFNIEKSKDGSQWRVINTLPSAGNSNEKIDYYYEDVDATTGAYYRLNQVDIDGKNKIYGPIKADCELEKDLFYSFPNPSGQGGFSVLLNAKELIGHGNLNISDANGTSVYQKSVEIEKGVSLWNINEPNLAPGVYFIKVANDNNESKIIKHIQN